MNRLGGTTLLALACVALASCAQLSLPAAVPPGTPGNAASAQAGTAMAAAPAHAAPAAAAASAARAGPGGAQASGPRPSASAPEAGQPPLRPFQTVVQGATREVGFFTTWRKDDKVWIEVSPAQWGQRFFFSLNTTHGIGEGSLFGNQMGGFVAAGRARHVASLQRFGPQGVQLVAHNTGYLAAEGNPARAMLERSFSDSLLAQAAVVSQPHPASQAVLVEANALVVNDYPMGAAQLERQYRQGYAFDTRNSGIQRVRQSEHETGFQVRAHYGLGRVAQPGAGGPSPSLPGTVPDARSLFLGYYWGFSRLPDPMRPRVADPRVGYFATEVADFSEPNRRKAATRYIARWRLAKKDPAAALSEPKQPIVYWLDRNIPLAYREVVKAGVLEWNKAFERIGFKNAIEVRQQGADEDIDTSSTRIASIRWVAGNGISFAGRGPSKTDPRTGEILDADIEINESVTRIYGSRVAEDPPRPMGQAHGHAHAAGDHCDYADAKMEEAAFALDVLVARGDLVWGTPAAERWVMDAIKDLVTHEVGHTLGLRHNFRGSMAVPEARLSDAAWGAEHGISASVMDYNAVNIAPLSERQGAYWMTTLGAYDYWAIEYGYRPAAPEAEAGVLAGILARSGEPGHAYATDEDAGGGGWIEGVDPEVSRRDLSDNPLGFYRKRFSVVRELWQRLEANPLPAGTPYDQLRRNFERGFRMLSEVSDLTARYVGGMTVRREVAGARGQPMAPVDAQRQRLALQLLTRHLFEVDAFRFKPEFLGRLLPDMDERASDPDASLNKLDLSVAQRVFGVQRSVLAQLLRDSVAARVIDAREQAVDAGTVLSLPELYGSLQKAVWRDLAGAAPIPLMRRNLQREHVRLLVEAVARPGSRMPADARALQREFAQRLLRDMRAAVAARGETTAQMETRAHLKESIDLLDAALKAQVMRSLG